MPSSNFMRYNKVPDVTTKKSMPVTTNFAKGINTYKPNDSISENELHLAQNARFERIGEYKTRRGLSLLSRPIGEALVVNTISATYDMVELSKLTTSNCTIRLDDDESGEVEEVAQSNRVIFAISLIVAADNVAYGCLQVNIKPSADSDEILATSVIPHDEISYSDPKEIELLFAAAPDANLDSYYIELVTQHGGERRFRVAVTNGRIACKVRTAAKGAITSVFEANLSDSTSTNTDKSVLFTFKEDESESNHEQLYRYTEDDEVVFMGYLETNGEPVRYSQDGGVVRCAFGQSPYALNTAEDNTNTWGIRKIDTIDLESDVDLMINVSNIMTGTADNLLYFDRNVNTQLLYTHPYTLQYVKEADFITTATINAWVDDETEVTTTFSKSTLQEVSPDLPTSKVAVGHLITDETGEHYGYVTKISGDNITVKADAHISKIIGSYDKFDSDYRQNFPTINTGDPITAMFNLAGAIFITTRRHKYMMTISSDSYHLTPASSQCTADGGAFSQEAVVCGSDRAYYANDSGIFLFDGYNETSITANTIQDKYDEVKNKQDIKMEYDGNRLYVLCPDVNPEKPGVAFIFNTSLGFWESIDTDLYISAMSARKSPTNRFICGHSRLGMLVLANDSDNEYNDLGAPLHFELDTAYQHFDAPSQLKRVTKWRPEFATAKQPYYVQCGYALDFTDDVKYSYSINLLDQIPRKEAYVWDDPNQFNTDSTPAKLTTIPKIHDDFRRCQIRYQHIAAFEPVNFKTHTLTIQTQRIR